MTNNPSFSNPNPSLTEITTAVDELTQAFALDQAAKSEVSTRVVTQENAEARLDQGLTKLAAYVESVAGKDDSLRIKYPSFIHPYGVGQYFIVTEKVGPIDDVFVWLYNERTKATDFTSILPLFNLIISLDGNSACLPRH